MHLFDNATNRRTLLDGMVAEGASGPQRSPSFAATPICAHFPNRPGPGRLHQTCHLLPGYPDRRAFAGRKRRRHFRQSDSIVVIGYGLRSSGLPE
jgi:hypothetical protein